MSLAVGANFPIDVPVESPNGPVRLSEMLSAGPLVVAFHRLWDPFCQQAARDLLAGQYKFDARGARVVIIYRDDIKTVTKFNAAHGIPFHAFSDPEHELETAAEVAPFSPVRYMAFSPKRMVDVLREGHLSLPHSGLLQGRATFVIDHDGLVVYAHRSVNAADIAPLEDILEAVQSVPFNRTETADQAAEDAPPAEPEATTVNSSQ